MKGEVLDWPVTWKNSLLEVYILRYTPYKVLEAHRRRLEPPIRGQWRPLAAIWKNSLLKAYIHRYTPYQVLGAHRRRLEPSPPFARDLKRGALALRDFFKSDQRGYFFTGCNAIFNIFQKINSPS